MALSGSFYKYPVSKFGLYCEWSGSQSITGNYTNITLKVYLQFYSLDVGSRSDSTISINGTSETYTAPAIDDMSTGSWHKVLLKTKTVKVTHNSDGTKTGVPLSVSWRFDGSYSGTSIGTITASASVDLDKIDRTAPTVSFASSNITASGFKISATSSATADIWQYSTDNGTSWTQFSTTAGTSASTTISSLSPNTTYKVKVRARKKSNQVYGTSSASSIKTLGGAVVNSVNAVTADAATVSIKLNVTVYEASYTNTLVLKNGSTTYLTISGLSWTKGTADRTVTLTAAQRTSLLDSMSLIKSFTGTFAVSTYSGSTQIGSTSSKTATVQTTSATSAPTLSGFTFADSNSTTTAITGSNQIFIQSNSTLQVTPGIATAKNGASITNYTATCNGVSVSNTSGSALSVGKVSKSGSVSVVLTVTDSRGYTASVSQNITVVAYAKPKVSSITLRRTNDIEAEMQLTFNGSISAVSVGGTQKNALKYVRYRYKLTSATSYGSYVNILSSVSASGTSFSFSNLELCNLTASSSYDFHLQIRDKLDSTTSLDLHFVVPQGTPLVALRKGKVGINTPSPTEALHVVGNAKVSGTLTAGTLSGSLAASNLSSAVPISKGGTGATTAAAACANIVNSQNISPQAIVVGSSRYFIDDQYGINMQNSDIIGSNGICFKDAVDSSGEGLFFYRSSGYYDRVYANAGVLYFAPNCEKSTHPGTRYTVHHTGNTVAVGNGGTGATTAASARSNLGIKATSLYSGTMTTDSLTFTYSGYKAFVIIGQVVSGRSRVSMCIPAAQITSSAVLYQLADDVNYYSFSLSYSGSTATLTYSTRSSSGQILRVYGLN